jgi:hypothetical protein
VSQRDWPTEPVHLNHLEAMGIAMALMGEEERDGLSEPQRGALAKVQDTLGVLLDQLGRPS